MDWFTALKSFNSIVEHKSFSKAAQKRYASSSALSKHVAWLEQQLKLTLIDRSPHYFKVTESGETLYQYSRFWVADLERVKAELTLDRVALAGPLRVSLPRSLGQILIAPHLTQFMKQYPAIRLSVTFDNRYVHLQEEGVDVCVRVGAITEKGLVSESLGSYCNGVYAAPDYLHRSAPLDEIDDIVEHRCLVHSDFNEPHLWRFKDKTLHVTPALITNNRTLLVNAAIAGEGLLYLSELAVSEAVNNKQLVPLFVSQQKPPLAYTVVTPRTQFQSERVQCFLRFLRTCLDLNDLS